MDIETVVVDIKALDTKAIVAIHAAIAGAVPVLTKIKADKLLFGGAAGFGFVVGVVVGHWVL